MANNNGQQEDIKVTLPWLCRDCEKTPAACGKNIAICEAELYRINEYERGHA
ncbi:MAG TPA: hypothetical protein PLO06_11440 [Methanoregulaceae archaeon]|nr:hypothetical protein [Methanoregulaceae archaeon]